MFNLNAYMFYERLHKTYGNVARVYGFFGVGPLAMISDHYEAPKSTQSS